MSLLPVIFNMSVTASIMILAVLVLRFFFRKAPKLFSYLLWGIVLFRLLCPVALPSSLSFLHLAGVSVAENGAIEYVPVRIERNALEETHATSRWEESGQGDALDDSRENFQESFRENEMERWQVLEREHSALEVLLSIWTVLWLLGILVLLAYSLFSLFLLRRKTACSVRLRDNVYLADYIASPFVLGLVRPRIYLPFFLEGPEREYIILHEQQHIRRGDHVAKLLFFAAQCLHWFNPLVWLAFYLAGKDMEMSCDEAVMRRMEGDIREEYSMSLLRLATGRRFIASCPLAFGEGNPKNRIKNVMAYKKPGRAVVVVSVICCVLAVFCLVTNPKKVRAERPEAENLEREAPVEAGEKEHTDKETTDKEPEMPAGTPETTPRHTAPTKEEVLAARESALKGMTEEEIARLTENIKLANLRLESSYLYENLFSQLEDPNDLYWNLFDQRGEVQIGWHYGGDYQEINEIRERENLTMQEFLEKYGTPETRYNRFDAESFAALVEDMQKSVRDEDLWNDLQYIIDEVGLAAETHEVEHANNLYKMLHDMDYFLLRYGLEDVGKYTQDDSLVNIYYGMLSAFCNI